MNTSRNNPNQMAPPVPPTGVDPPAVPAVAIVIPTVIVIPITALTISNGMFSTLASDDKFTKLSLSKDNWPKWSQKIMEVMEMSELDEYLDGTVPEPDAAV